MKLELIHQSDYLGVIFDINMYEIKFESFNYIKHAFKYMLSSLYTKKNLKPRKSLISSFIHSDGIELYAPKILSALLQANFVSN